MNEAEFDKIIEYDGNFVVKYKMRITNVEDIKDYFRDEELDKKYENNEPRKRITDLSSIPFPEYDVFDSIEENNFPGGHYPLVTSRGCPFNEFHQHH
jgi:radical SAM superfamily enzyme YgiQ (UPF0313 family)